MKIYKTRSEVEKDIKNGVLKIYDVVAIEQGVIVIKKDIQDLKEQRESILEEVEKKILELIAYSSFDITCGGEVKDRNCTVEEAMSELSKDVEQLFKNYKALEEKGYKIVKKY